MPGVVPSSSAWDRVRTVVRGVEGEPIGMTDEARRRRFNAGAYQVALLYLTSAATPGGLYNAKRFPSPDEMPTTGSSVAVANIGTLPTDPDCYYFNLAEIAAATHDLTDAANTNQLTFIGLRWGSADDGKPVYLSTGLWLQACETTSAVTDDIVIDGSTYSFVNGVLVGVTT